MARGYNPQRLTMTERLAFSMSKDKKKVISFRHSNKGCLPWQRHLVVTSFAKQKEKPTERKVILPIKTGDKVLHSAGGIGFVRKVDSRGIWVNMDPKHGDNLFNHNQVCRQCKMIFASADINRLHREHGHRREYPYVTQSRKISKSEERYMEAKERRTVAQYVGDNRELIQVEE
jgi:hypothetical protein